MRIETLHLKNYRCFRALSVDFHPQMTVLVAPNGQGKTSVLDAIKVALWPFVAGFDLGSSTNDVTGIHIDDVCRERESDPQIRHSMEWRLPAEVKATGQLQVRQLLWDDAVLTALGQLSVLESLRRGGGDGSLDIAEAFAADVPWQGVRYRDSIRKNTKTKELVVAGSMGLRTAAKGLEMRLFLGHQSQPDDLPMLGYYGTGRLWAQKQLTVTADTSHEQAASRTFAYRDCMDPASSYKHFAAWFSRVHQSLLQAQIRNLEKGWPLMADVPYGLIAPFQAVQEVVSAVLKPHTGWHTLEYSAEHGELVLNHDEHGELKVSQLSDGIRNMLALVGDVAYRCLKLNPHLGERAPRATHGVVLIDEVDMHLHPTWQQTVLTDLMNAFPKLQFIVSTHSPQVLSAISREHIRMLQSTSEGWSATLPTFSPLAHEAGDALSHIMGTHPQAQSSVLEQARQYEQWVRSGQENSESARGLKQTLDDAGYQIKASDLDTWRFLARLKSGQQG
jgi:predicted ATP-binding protein involved in virulence